MLASYKKSRLAAFMVVLSLALGFHAYAQSGGSSTSVTGSVVDPTGAVVPNAVVEIRNPVSAFERTVTTDNGGKFSIPNIPFNPYHLAVTGPGFAPYAQDVDVRSIVPVTVSITLQVKGSSETVTVEGAGQDLLENTSTFHTDVDRGLFDKMPLESASSSLSSLVTLSSPGIAADSNGLFHGLGDHAENSFSVDGQPITDQQSKVFSNQIPLDSIESMEVISGAPPAEFGEKTSVVINVTTRSGQGMTTPKGSITTSYGSFGTADVGINLGYGGQNWGNFISASGLNSGRFLDPPEFAVFHDKGNEENIFDRVDFQLSKVDSVHVNLGFTRSWFQTPNAFDNLNTRRDRPGVGQSGRPHRPALANQDLQHCALLDPADQSQHGVHLGRIRAPRPVQLLSQRQSVFRSRPHSAGDRQPGPHPDQRRSAFGYLLGEGNSQPESRSHLSTDLPRREHQLRSGRSRAECSLL